jgi:hypothetical protein
VIGFHTFGSVRVLAIKVVIVYATEDKKLLNWLKSGERWGHGQGAAKAVYGVRPSR